MIYIYLYTQNIDMFPLNISPNGDMDITRVNVGKGALATTSEGNVVLGDGIENVDRSSLQIGLKTTDQVRDPSVTKMSIYTTGNYIPEINSKDSSMWVTYEEESTEKTASGITFSGRNFGDVTTPFARVSAFGNAVSGDFTVEAFRPLDPNTPCEYQQNRFETGIRVVKGTPPVIRSIGFIADLSSIVYNEELFVVMSRTGTTNQAYLTSDGVNWVDRRTILGTFSWNSITFGLGLYVAVSSIIATSPEGTDWTQQTSAPSLSYTGVVFGNGKFVAVGTNGIAHSSNGITWTLSSSFTSRSYTRVTFGEGRFVAVSPQGISTSTDGNSWSNSTTSAIPYTGVTYGNEEFVAVASDGTVSQSFDGLMWTSHIPLTGVSFTNVKFVGGLFVATAQGIVAISLDGETWDVKYNLPGQVWNDVAFGNGRFIVVGDNSRVLKFIVNLKTSIILNVDSVIPASTDRLYIDVMTGEAESGVYDVSQLTVTNNTTEIIVTHPTKEIIGKSFGSAFLSSVHRYSRPALSSVYTVTLNKISNEFSSLSVDDLINVVFIDPFDRTAVSSTFKVTVSNNITGVFSFIGAPGIQTVTDADCLVFGISHKTRLRISNEGRVGVNLSGDDFGFNVLGDIGIGGGVFNALHDRVTHQLHNRSGDVIPAEDGKPVDVFKPDNSQVDTWMYTLENKENLTSDFEFQIGTPFALIFKGTSEKRLAFKIGDSVFEGSTPESLITKYVVGSSENKPDPFVTGANVPEIIFNPGLYGYDIRIFNPSLTESASMSIFDDEGGRVEIWPSFPIENFSNLATTPSSVTRVIGVIPPNAELGFVGVMRIPQTGSYRFAYSTGIYQRDVNSTVISSTFKCYFTPVELSFKPATFTSVSYDFDGNVISSGSAVVSNTTQSGLYKEGETLSTPLRSNINTVEEGLVCKIDKLGSYQWSMRFFSPDGGVIVTSTPSKTSTNIYVVVSINVTSNLPSNTIRMLTSYPTIPSFSDITITYFERTIVVLVSGTGVYISHINVGSDPISRPPVFPMGLDVSNDGHVSFAMACKNRLRIRNSAGTVISRFAPSSSSDYIFKEPTQDTSTINVKYIGDITNPNRFRIFNTFENLRVWYDFENRLTDMSGNNLDATGVVSYLTRTGTKIAANFNGTSNFLEIPPIPTTLSEITVSFWLFARTQNTTISSIYSTDIYVAGSLHLNINSGRIQFNTPTGQVLSTLINLNQWYYVTCTDTGTTMSIYLNGVLNNQSTPAGVRTYTLGDARIGAWNDSRYFNGALDEFRIYGRVLTIHEIEFLFEDVLQNTNISISSGVDSFSALGDRWTINGSITTGDSFSETFIYSENYNFDGRNISTSYPFPNPQEMFKRFLYNINGGTIGISKTTTGASNLLAGVPVGRTYYICSGGYQPSPSDSEVVQFSSFGQSIPDSFGGIGIGKLMVMTYTELTNLTYRYMRIVDVPTTVTDLDLAVVPPGDITNYLIYTKYTQVGNESIFSLDTTIPFNNVFIRFLPLEDTFEYTGTYSRQSGSVFTRDIPIIPPLVIPPPPGLIEFPVLGNYEFQAGTTNYIFVTITNGNLPVGFTASEIYLNVFTGKAVSQIYPALVQTLTSIRLTLPAGTYDITTGECALSLVHSYDRLGSGEHLFDVLKFRPTDYSNLDIHNIEIDNSIYSVTPVSPAPVGTIEHEIQGGLVRGLSYSTFGSSILVNRSFSPGEKIWIEYDQGTRELVTVSSSTEGSSILSGGTPPASTGSVIVSNTYTSSSNIVTVTFPESPFNQTSIIVNCSFSKSGTTITVTSPIDHEITTNHIIRITNSVDLDGEYTVTSFTSREFTFTNTVSTIDSGTLNVVKPSNYTRSGNTVSVITPSPHRLRTGMSVIISNASGGLPEGEYTIIVNNPISTPRLFSFTTTGSGALSGATDVFTPSHKYVPGDSVGLRFNNGRMGGYAVTSVTNKNIVTTIPGIPDQIEGFVEVGNSYTVNNNGDITIKYINEGLVDGEYVFLEFPYLGFTIRHRFNINEIDTIDSSLWMLQNLQTFDDRPGYVRIYREGYSKIGERHLVKVPNHLFSYNDTDQGFKLLSSSEFYNNNITIQSVNTTTATFTDPRLIIDGTGVMDVLPAFTVIDSQTKRLFEYAHGRLNGDLVAVMGSDNRASVNPISNIFTDSYEVSFGTGYNPSIPRIVYLFDASGGTVVVKYKSHGYTSGQNVGLSFPRFENDDSNIQYSSVYTITTVAVDTFTVLIPGIPDQTDAPVDVLRAYLKSGSSITVTQPGHGFSNGDQAPIYLKGEFVISDSFTVSSSTPSQYTLTSSRFTDLPSSGSLRSVYRYSSLANVITFTPRRGIQQGQTIARWFYTLPTDFKPYTIRRVFNTLYAVFVDNTDIPIPNPGVYRILEAQESSNVINIRALPPIQTETTPTFGSKKCVTFYIDQSQEYTQPTEPSNGFDPLPTSGLAVVTVLSKYDRLNDGKYLIFDLGKNFEIGERVYIEFIEPPLSYVPGYTQGDVDAVSGVFTVINRTLNGQTVTEITVQSTILNKQFGSGMAIVNPYITLPALPSGDVPPSSGVSSISPLISYKVSSTGVYTFFDEDLKFKDGDDVFIRFANPSPTSGVFILTGVSADSFSVTASGTQTGAERLFAFIEKLDLPENNGDPIPSSGTSGISQVVNYTSPSPTSFSVPYPLNIFGDGSQIVVKFYDTGVIVTATVSNATPDDFDFTLPQAPVGILPASGVRKMTINLLGDNVFELRNLTNNTTLRSYTVPRNTTFQIPQSSFIIPLDSQIALVNATGFYSSSTSVSSARLSLAPNELFVSENQLRISLFKLNTIMTSVIGEASLTTGTISSQDLGFIDQGLAAFRIKEGVVRHDSKTSGGILYFTSPSYSGLRFYYYDDSNQFTDRLLKNLRGAYVMGLGGQLKLRDISMFSTLRQASSVSGSVVTTSIDLDRGGFGDLENPNIYICGTTVGAIDFRATIRVGDSFIDLPGGGSRSAEGQGAFICKFNSRGDLLWFSLVDGSDSEQAVSIAVSDDEQENVSGVAGVYVLGSFISETANIFESRKGTLNVAETSIRPVETLIKTLGDRSNRIQREAFILKFNQDGQHVLSFRSSSTGLISPVYLDVGVGDNVIACMKSSNNNLSLNEPDGRVSRYISRKVIYDMGVLIKYRTTNSLSLRPTLKLETNRVIRKKIINKSEFPLYIAAYTFSSGISNFLTDVFVIQKSSQLTVFNNGDIWYAGASERIASDLLFLDTDNGKFGFGTSSPTLTLDIRGDLNIEGIASFSSLTSNQDAYIGGSIQTPAGNTSQQEMKVITSGSNAYLVTWFPVNFTSGNYNNTNARFVILDGVITTPNTTLIGIYSSSNAGQILRNNANQNYNLRTTSSVIQEIEVNKGTYRYDAFITNDSNTINLIVSLVNADTEQEYGVIATVNSSWDTVGGYAGIINIPVTGFVRVKFSNNYYQYSSRVALSLVQEPTEYSYQVNGKPLIPRGMIVIWNSSSSVPRGWAQCDGRTVNGFKTPDLRGRFVLGYSAFSGDVPNNPGVFNPDNRPYFVNTFPIGQVSGESTNRLQVDQLPSHTHKIPYRSQQPPETRFANNNFNLSGPILGYNEVTEPEGLSLPHNNMPPYHVLMYICKV